MHLKHIKTVIPAQDIMAKISGISWSPNNQKLAVCTSDRIILLFDEQGVRRDRFATKPSDSKFGKESYVVTGIAFSPCSTKLAVAQSDHMIYVYKLGDKWEEKKVICNKFPQTCPVTALLWPQDQPIIYGLADGKVRLANPKTNKSSNLYTTNSMVISLACNQNGKYFVSGHADGTIVRCSLDSDDETRGKFAVHPSPPYALQWAGNFIVAAGCDRRIYFYGQDGRVMQQFDYSKDDSEKAFSAAAASASGHSVVIGSFDRLRLFNWSPRKGTWEEGQVKEIPNLYTIKQLAWRKDGSKVTMGSLCGAVDTFDCCLKKTRYKNKFEISYVGPSQVIVRHLQTGTKVMLKSYFGYEIDDVKIMGQDRYMVAHTSDTLLLGDLVANKLSEVQWHGVGGKEKYYFGHENVCIIFNAGELTMVEYGCNEILGCVRTEFMNPFLLSLRVNERKQLNVDNNKKLAYLIDLKTIAILDLCTGFGLGQVEHDSKIDWLELNETGRKLLFRDKKFRLYLYDVESSSKSILLNYCTYVQWVPGSDVVVAQSRDQLCIWYNINSPDRITNYPLKGDVVDIEKHDNITEVLVSEGVTTMSYKLDEGLIEFGTAIDDGDFGRASVFLEGLEVTEETSAMWRQLGQQALDAGQLHVAERCFAALGDVCKARYLSEVKKLALVSAGHDPGTTDPSAVESSLNHFTVRAKLAILEKNLKMAELIYLEHNCVDDAIEMYLELNKWDEAITVAEIKGHPRVEDLRRRYQEWLMNTGQEDKAGEAKEREGDYLGAVSLYMKAGLAGKAARLVLEKRELSDNTELVQRIAQILLKGEFYEKAGELYERIRNHPEAMRCYRRGKSFQKAIELARMAFPADVVQLEEQWGDYLVSVRHLDSAIHHFIEAGAYMKAVDAAVTARQWAKAAHILENINASSKEASVYYLKLANHFASVKDYKKAEEYFLKVDAVREAVDMYNMAGMWEEAHRLASHSMEKDDLNKMYLARAAECEAAEKYKEAEKLFLAVKEADKAISMYKRVKMYKDVVRLVKQYHPDLLEKTYYHLAQELEGESNYKQSEQFLMEAGDWKACVSMYRNHNLWEDAYRVALNSGDAEAPKQVAYLWAKHLGGDSAIRLLTKLGLLEKAIEYAADHCAFDFAFELCRGSNSEAIQNKLPEVHNKYAMYLEDEGKFQEAEREFIKSKKPREAVLMYVHLQDWDSAQRVAEAHDPESVSDILVGQARFAFEAKDYPKAESFLLRAQRPDMAVKFYRETGMWQDALRVCKEYLPHKLAALQEEYDQEMAASRGSGAETLLEQARQWEASGDHLRAVECYVKLTNEVTSDQRILRNAWVKAAELAVKFLDSQKALKVVNLVGPRLMDIKSYGEAAKLYLSVELAKEAIEAFVLAEEWNKAKKVAKEFEPRMENYVNERYKQSLVSSGKTDQLVGVDIMSALEQYAAQGQWEKVMNTAQQQNNPQLLHKFAALYATQLIKESKAVDALQIYVKHGAPAMQQNFNIYKRIFQEITAMRGTMKASTYKILSQLRDMLHSIVKAIGSKDSPIAKEFHAMLLTTHYMTNRCAALAVATHGGMKELAAKLSVALLRHTDILSQGDKAYFEAGQLCKAVGWESMAFVFFNRYLDLLEAIEEGSSDALDNSDFEGTDIPLEIPLPSQPYTTKDEYEEAREWVLAVSMDQRVERILPKDERGYFEACLFKSPPCVISGYPVLSEAKAMKFNIPPYVANKDEWNRFLMAEKASRSTECSDVIRFLHEWCGSSPNPTYSLK